MAIDLVIRGGMVVDGTGAAAREGTIWRGRTLSRLVVELSILSNVKIEVARARGGLRVRCEVAVTHNTGVEMEALTGASVAALTIYDMCKALSHEIEIGPVRLLAKSGGRRNYRRGGRA